MNTMLGRPVQNSIAALNCNSSKICGMDVTEHLNRYYMFLSRTSSLQDYRLNPLVAIT